MAESDDVNTLKRRGRRRLVGAIALVLAAVIVLPMVFDSEPKGSAPPVSVRIPGEDESGFAPKVAQKAPPETKALEKAAEKSSEQAVEKSPEKAVEAAPAKAAEKAAEAPAEKASPAPAPKIEITVKKGGEKPAAVPEVERKRAETALAGGEQFMVPAGAYLDPAPVIEKLKAAKIPYYVEQPLATKDGKVTRVRAGPYASRDAAEKALKQLKDLGLKPGSVAPKS
jgi:DedD protein